MSDNEDAASEVAPEAWSTMFDRFVAGKAQSEDPKKVKRPKPSKAAPQENSWFSGLFASKPDYTSRRSSVSSDTPFEKESESDNDGDLRKLAGMDQEDEQISESEASSASDGAFKNLSIKAPTQQSKADSASPSSSKSPSEIDEDLLKRFNAGELESVDELPEGVRRTSTRASSRKERLKNRNNFTITHDASELGTIDEITTESKQAVAPVPTEPIETHPDGQSIAWWQAYVPAGLIAATASAEPAESNQAQAEKVEETKPADVIAEPEGDSMWNKFFGGAKPSDEVSPRSMLPQIRAPPEIPALAEVNSYFTSVPVAEPSINLLGPRPISHFEGRLRGWPRGLAPYWSTREINQSHVQRTVFQSSEINGMSALAMFRVT